MVAGELWVCEESSSSMSVKWKISNLFQRSWKPGECLMSREFSFAKFDGTISMLPKGTEENADFIGFCVLCHRRNRQDNLKMGFELSLRFGDDAIYDDASRKELHETKDGFIYFCDFPRQKFECMEFVSGKRNQSQSLPKSFMVSCKLTVEENVAAAEAPTHAETSTPTHAEGSTQADDACSFTESATGTEPEPFRYTDACTLTEEASSSTEQSSHTEATTQTEAPVNIEPEMEQAVRSGSRDVELHPTNDLASLLISGEDADVTIRVEGEDFKAHMSILVGRSPVFAAVVQQALTKTTTGIAAINVFCSASVFRAFLRFVYSWKVETVPVGTAFELYAMADRYKLDELKRQCVKCTESNDSKPKDYPITVLAA